jgi:hypothetical protein
LVGSKDMAPVVSKLMPRSDSDLTLLLGSP